MKKYILSAFSVLFLCSSCVDTSLLPTDRTVDEDFWQTKEEVSSMVNGAYKGMLNESVVANLIAWGDLRSDELEPNPNVFSSTTQKLDEIHSVNIQPSNPYADWSSLYAVINTCNIVLERANGVRSIDPNYTEGDYESDCSQMLALRSLCYFYLVRAYRDVPYITKAFMNSSQDRLVSQSAPDSVLAGCISDLERARKGALDPAAYTVGDWKSRGIINRDAIDALLADIYLWRAAATHNTTYYQQCVNYCDEVIASKKANHPFSRHDLGTKDYYLSNGDEAYGDIFISQNSEESIFELQYDGTSNSNSALCKFYYKFGNNNSSQGFMKATSIFGSSGISAPVFINANDYRYANAVYQPNSSDVNFDVKKMISMQRDNSASAKADRARAFDHFEQNFIIYRLADVMLMKAEALTALATANDDPGLRQAFNLVQTVNTRSLDPQNYSDSLKWNTYSNVEAMEKLVLAERQRELCFEGKRWYDLMRYNYRHLDHVLDYTKTFAQLVEAGVDIPKNYKEMLNLMARKYVSGSDAMKAKMRTEAHLYMPVPYSDMQVNKKLVQNPVYNSDSEYERN